MSYGLLLAYKIQTASDLRHKVEIYKRDYSGSSYDIDSLIKDSLVLNMDVDSINDPIRISTLSFSILQDIPGFDYTQFFTPDSTLFKVVWESQQLEVIPPSHLPSLVLVTRWSGYLTTDMYKEPLKYRGAINLSARDCLGRLNDIAFDLPKGRFVSINNLVDTAISKAGVTMPVEWQSTKYAEFPGEIDIQDGMICTTKFTEEDNISWWDVLEKVLKGIGCYIGWHDNNKIIIRDISAVEEDWQEPYFVDKSGYREIQAAWKNLKITQDYGKRDNFYDGQFSEVDCGGQHYFTPSLESPWTIEGGVMQLANPFYTPAGDNDGYTLCEEPEEAIMLPIIGSDNVGNALVWQCDMPAIQGGFEIKLSLNNALWRDGLYCETFAEIAGTSLIDPSYQINHRMDVFFVRNGITYILRDKWEEYGRYRAEHTSDKYLSKTTSCPLQDKQSSVSDEDMTITAKTTPGAGKLIFKLYQPNARITNPSMYLPTGSFYTRIAGIEMTIQGDGSDYSKTIAINPNYNIKGELSLEIGQIPVNAGNALKYLGGLYADDSYHTPLGSFGNDNISGQDLADLVAKEYIMRRNAAYDILSGTLMCDAHFYFDKEIYIADTDNMYQLISASLRIISNTLEVNSMIAECEFPGGDTLMFSNPNNFAVTVTLAGQSGSISVPAKSSMAWPTSFGGGDTVTWYANGGSGSRSGNVTISGYTDINIGYLMPSRYSIVFQHSNNVDVTVTISGDVNTSFVVVSGYAYTMALTEGKSITWSAAAVGYTTRAGSITDIHSIQSVNVTLQPVVVQTTDVAVSLNFTAQVPEPYTAATFIYQVSGGASTSIQLTHGTAAVIEDVTVGSIINWEATYPDMEDKEGTYTVPATGAEINVTF